MTQTQPNIIKARSYLAPNMLWFYQTVCEQLQEITGLTIQLETSPYDALDDTALQESQIDLAFICGLPMVRLNENLPGLLLPLVAPIADDPHGQGKAVYFADVIVQRESRFQNLNDLKEARFCYNDPGSNSGHHLLRYHMLQQGYPKPFFGSSIQSGSHQQSIQRIIAGEADCAAIDSLVLAQAVRDNPDIATQIRIIESVGPCPVPPLAISGYRAADYPILQAALTQPNPALQAAFQRAGLKGFAPCTPDDYAVILEMYKTAEAAGYQIIR